VNPEPDFLAILKLLVESGVEFIVVAGVSAALQGAPLMTFDLDIVHRRSPENLRRLDRALDDLAAIQREQPERKLRPRIEHLASPGHLLLTTNAGPLGLLGTIGRGEDYEDLIARSEELEVAGLVIRVLGLETLIQLKEELGREKDVAVLAVLRHTLEEKRKGRPAPPL
jgi:hypothetical protein